VIALRTLTSADACGVVAVSTLRRRVILGTTLAVASSIVPAQQRRKRVAFVATHTRLAAMQGPEPESPAVRAFVHRLRELGHRDGQGVTIELHSAEGRVERIPELMREVVAAGPDVIVTNAVGPAADTTLTIPIVGPLSANLLLRHLVASALPLALVHPSRNVTGILSDLASMNGKRLELLKEAAPTISRIAFVADIPWSPDTSAAADALGLTLWRANVDRDADLDPAFGEIVRQRADALLVVSSGVNFANRRRIIDFAAARRLPAIYEARELADSDGLIVYGVNTALLYRGLGDYVDRILRGASPRDLPIEQASRFELVINRRTAHALGLELPRTLLLRATEVID
jgi:putative ABC transport system substrate-binding protein